MENINKNEKLGKFVYSAIEKSSGYVKVTIIAEDSIIQRIIKEESIKYKNI